MGPIKCVILYSLNMKQFQLSFIERPITFLYRPIRQSSTYRRMRSKTKTVLEQFYHWPRMPLMAAFIKETLCQQSPSATARWVPPPPTDKPFHVATSDGVSDQRLTNLHLLQNHSYHNQNLGGLVPNFPPWALAWQGIYGKPANQGVPALWTRVNRPWIGIHEN